MRGFGSLRFFSTRPRDAFTNTVKKMGPMVHNNLRHWVFDRRGRQTFELIWDRQRRADRPANLGSNKRARNIAGSTLRFRMNDLVEDTPELRLRFATLISDHFNTNDRETTLRLGVIKETVGQVMAGSGLDGWIGVVELQPAANSYAGVGRDLLGHMHLILWTQEPSYDLAALEARLAESARLACASGAATVLFTGSETDAASTLDRLRWVRDRVWYMVKYPVHAKNLVHKRGGKPRFFGCSVAPNLAVRLLEILSRLRVDELIMGSGQGRAMADAVRQRVRTLTSPYDFAGLDRDIAEFWAYHRRANGKDLYRPVLVERWRHGERTKPYKRGPYRRKSIPVDKDSTDPPRN